MVMLGEESKCYTIYDRIDRIFIITITTLCTICKTYYQQLSIFIGFFEGLKCLNICCRKLSFRLLSCEQYGHLNFSFGGRN